MSGCARDRWTFHGGRLTDACAAYGGTPGEWLDLSTGINPNPWPVAAGFPVDWHRLPDERALADLEAAAAACFGVDPAYVCALPGTEIGLRLFGTLVDGAAHHVGPGYRTHGEMVRGSTAIAFDTLEAAAPSTLVLANPANPDGRIAPVPTLLALLERTAGTSNWLIVDEAFADAVPDCSLARHIDDGRQLVIFRSFGKFFGLAGVRLGFMLGPVRMIARMRALLGGWPLSAAAIAIGTAAYRDGEWIARTRHALQAQVDALDAVLARHRIAPAGACPLFRLVTVEDAAALFKQLARRRILTRPFDYDSRWLRIGLPRDEAALARLDRAIVDG